MNPKRERMALVLLIALPLLAACDRGGQEAERVESSETSPGAPPAATPMPAPAPVPSDRVGEDTLGEKIDRAGDEMQAQGERLGAALDDAAVTARVKAALLADPSLSALKIEVDSEHGVVVLRGSVESAEAGAHAEQLARSTEGVVSVDNQLVVTPGGGAEMPAGE